MPTNVIMPALGVAQQTGTLLKWVKAEGQSVSKGEPLMEIETDKATVEIEAAASGILTGVTAKPGDEIPVGQKIAVILAPGEALPTKQEKQAATTQQPQHPQPGPLSHEEGKVEARPLPAAGGIPDKDRRPSQEKRASVVSPLPLGEGRGEGRLARAIEPSAPTERIGSRVLSSPKAKRIAKEQGVDLKSLRGSGPEGSILATDVLSAVNTLKSEPATVPTPEAIVPMSSMRRIVGERMRQSKQSAPHFYLSMDIDMTAVNKTKTAWKQRGEPLIPSINDFILHAAARSLKNFPSVNSTYTEQGIKQYTDINIGVAVALDEGLVVPVLRNADRLTLSELAAQSRELIEKAQSKKLFPLDYEGGTFTVSNLGMFGIDSFIAIINPPQCAILAAGRVAPRVVVEDGMFAIKSLMTATLSADHRVIDGVIGAQFLGQFKRYLEEGEL